MPESAQSATVAAKSRQAAKAKTATLELMRAKKPRRKAFTLQVNGAPLRFVIESIGNLAYDALASKHPAKNEQRARGMNMDLPKFAPALMAAVYQEPKGTVEEWTEIWESDSWGQSELGVLYGEAVDICTLAVDATPIEAD